MTVDVNTVTADFLVAWTTMACNLTVPAYYLGYCADVSVCDYVLERCISLLVPLVKEGTLKVPGVSVPKSEDAPEKQTTPPPSLRLLIWREENGGQAFLPEDTSFCLAFCMVRQVFDSQSVPAHVEG